MIILLLGSDHHQYFDGCGVAPTVSRRNIFFVFFIGIGSEDIGIEYFYENVMIPI